MRKLLSCLGIVLCTVTVFAQQQPSQAEMEAMMKAMQPGEPHKKLQPFIGSWNATVRMWMDPAAPPTESSGTAEYRWIFDGRFVEETFKGSFMGQPFTGIGYTGYDNVRKHYISTWMDSMSTGLMTSSGTADSTGKYMVFSGSHADPMTGQNMNLETHLRVVSDNEHRMEMYGPGPDGKRTKMMEIVYTRRK